MKIDYALMGSNKNPLYLDFWPIVSKVWKKKFNITPVLGLISDEKPGIYEDEFGIIIKHNTFSGYSDGLLSQLVRLYLPKYLNGNCIVTDIDMIPLSKKYFVDFISEYDDNDFLILSSKHEQTINTDQYPMCYVVGHSDKYRELFSLENDWGTFISKVDNVGWYTDQKYLYKKINENKSINFFFPDRPNGFVTNRIDRINWFYDKNKVKSGFYIDSHLLRPFSLYQNEIQKLINLLDDECNNISSFV